MTKCPRCTAILVREGDWMICLNCGHEGPELPHVATEDEQPPHRNVALPVWGGRRAGKPRE